MSPSRQRVAARVAHGGHNIPIRDLERRFPRSWKNLFEEYILVVDRIFCFLNSESEARLIFEAAAGFITTHGTTHGHHWWAHLQRQAGL